VKNLKRFKLAETLLLGLVFAVFSTTFLRAQTTSASINGVVQDATGAVISNATVTAVNAATNKSTATVSQPTGAYTILGLQPSTYKLTVIAKGFPKYQQTGIVLELNQHATIVITLPIGTVQEEIVVNGDVSGLDVTSPVLSNEVNGTSIENLPLNTREAFSLLALTPGFSGSISNDYNGISYSINGGAKQFGDILVDGTPAGFPTVQGYQGIGVVPSVDAIGEFRLLSQTFPAEYGRTLDGILNVVYKSGSNAFHGTGFEFHRDSVGAANTFFNNRNHVKLPSFRRNQYGGVIEGPLYRNKLFFLASVEQLSQASFTSVTATVPTDAQREGDFSSTYGPNGNLVTIYNPFSTKYDSDSGNYIRTPYTNNKITSGLSTVGRNFLNYFPKANTTPSNAITNADNYYAVGNVIAPVRSWDVRADNVINNNSSIFFRYSNRYVWSTAPSLMPTDVAAATKNNDSGDTSNGFTLGYTNAIRTNVIYEARLGFARAVYDYRNKSLGFKASSLGLPSIIDSAPGNANTDYFPTIYTTNYLQLGQDSNRHNAFQTGSFLSSLMLERGKHVFKIGFDGRQIRVNDHEISQANGDFTFDASWTQGPNANVASTYAGNSVASLLVGMGTGQVIQDFKDVATESYYSAEYFQDDWKILPNLTLNYGIRYDLDSPRTERFNRMNYFDPDVATPLSSYMSGITGGLVYIGVNGKSRHQYHVDWNNIAPRVGFSWSVTPSTVVHAGSGIIYGASNQAASGDATPTGWRQTNTWVSSLDGITPYHTIDNPFPDGFPTITPVKSGVLTGAGNSIAGVIQHSPTPYTIQWSLDIQRSLPYNMTADVAYIGNRGRQLITSFESQESWDQLPVEQLSQGSALQKSVANPFYGNSAMTGSLAASTTTAGQLLLKYPQFSNVEIYHLMGGDSQYDGLQITLNKRMSSGLQLSGSYVWSKNFDQNSAHQNSFKPKADYAISAQDINQRVVVSYIYKLPFGRNQRRLFSLPTWGDDLIGGWQINGITTIQGGQPLQVTASNTLSAFNFQQLNANTNHQNPSYSGAVKNRLSKYFNTSDFSQPHSFTLGNGPAYYNSLRSPGTNNTDLSMYKDLSLPDKVNLELRVESYNTFNHPQFGSPNTSVTSSSFGSITSQANSPRQLQFGAKIMF